MTDKKRADSTFFLLSAVLFGGLALSIFAAPALRGLFYDIDYTKAQLFVSLLALLAGMCLFKQNIKEFKLSLVDFFVLSFLALYWFSLINALDPKEAVWGALRTTVYVFAFYLARYLSADKTRRRGLLLAICCGTVLISLTALLHAVDVLPVKLYNEYGAKRIISFLEHPNTFGTFSGIGLLLSLGFLAGDGARIFKALIGCGAYLNCMGLMGSQSRGSWVIIILALFFMGVMISGEQRKNYLLSVVVLFTAVLVTSKGYLDSFFILDYDRAVTWLITGIVFSLASNFLVTSRIGIISRHHPLARYRTAVLTTICLLIAINAVFYFTYTANYLPSPASQILSADIIERAEKISGQEGSYLGRIDMYRWALAIVADNPLSGSGGGGWESQYLRYQDKLYWSAEVHSHPLKIWVETGTFGFIAYLGLWFLILGRFLKSFILGRRSPLEIALFMALLAFFLHSAMDFDLSLPAISLVFWVLGGIAVAGKSRRRTWGIRAPAFLLPAVSLLLAVFLAYPAYGEYKAQLIYKDAQEAMDMGYHPMATDKLKMALDISPSSADIAADLALQWAYRYQDRGVEEYKNEALRYAESAVRLKPYSVKNAVKVEKAWEIMREDPLEAQQRLVFLVPKMPQLRLNLAQTYYSRALTSLAEGDSGAARNSLLKGREELAQMLENYLTAGKPWDMKPAPESNLLLGKMSLLLAEKERAVENLEIAAGNKKLQDQAIPWLALTYKVVQSEKYIPYYEKHVKSNSGYISEYEQAEQLLADLGE